MNNISHGILGQTTDYPKTYSPNILYPIARALGRESLAMKEFIGVDYWHAFEISWLDENNLSQVAMVRLVIPATSLYIVESKSLKLYFNSFNFTKFKDEESVVNTIRQDLSSCLKTDVEVQIFELMDNTMHIATLNSECIDGVLNKKIAILNDVDNSLLTDDTYNGETLIKQTYHSNLLRSNCPVTNQPDWGTVEIVIESGQLNQEKLLEYILSYRNHNGFHEQCVEQIFSDLTAYYNPKSLMVRAWYTRRGGIDINPIRVSDKKLLENVEFTRLIRQ